MGYVWVAPVVLVIALLIIFPLLWTFWTSFQSKLIGGPATYIGLGNYISILSAGTFQASLLKSLYFTVPSIILKLFIGLMAALILNRTFWGRNFFRTWLFIPWTLPRFAVAIIFIWILRQGGGLNLVLQQFGLPPVFWLGPNLAMLSMIAVNVWKGFPFFMVGILSGLQTIPKDHYEAASIDGASAWQQFHYITLPSVRNVILIISLISTIWTFSEFDVIFLLTGGGPGSATEVLPILTYVTAFRRYDLGQAAAIAVLTVPVFLALIIWLVRLVVGKEEG